MSASRTIRKTLSLGGGLVLNYVVPWGVGMFVLSLILGRYGKFVKQSRFFA